MEIFSPTITGSITLSSGSILQGTASYAVTASYAMNGGGGGGTGNGFPFSGSAVITGSLLVSGSGLIVTGSLNANSITGSLFGTATTASYVTASAIVGTVTSASYALTASYAMNAGTTIDTGSFVTTSSFNTFTSSFNTFTSSYNTGSFSGSFTGSLQGTASWAHSSSVAISSSYAINGGVTQILQGSNITVSGNGTGQVTISSTGGGSSYNTATGSYGSFYSTVTQTNVASTARSMSLNVTDISNGVSISGSTNPFNTYIKTENAGIYNIQFSAQVDKTDSGTDEIWVWLRKNGSNIADSATSIQLVGNGAHYVAAWNFFVNSSANDYYQLMWYSPDANVRLHAEAGFGVVPGIPSLIVTVNRVDQFLSNTGSFSGSFTGSFNGTATTASYYQETDPVFTAVSGTFVLTSSFNNFTSSINTWTSSYNTGSFSGSFIGTSSWAESASYLPEGTYQITASWAESASQALTSSYITGSSFDSNNPVLSASYATQSDYATNSTNVFINSGIPGTLYFAGASSPGAINSLYADTNVYINSDSTITAPGFTGSLKGTASWAANNVLGFTNGITQDSIDINTETLYVEGTADQINVAVNDSGVSIGFTTDVVFPRDVTIQGNLAVDGQTTFTGKVTIVTSSNLIVDARYIGISAKTDVPIDSGIIVVTASGSTPPSASGYALYLDSLTSPRWALSSSVNLSASGITPDEYLVSVKTTGSILSSSAPAPTYGGSSYGGGNIIIDNNNNIWIYVQ